MLYGPDGGGLKDLGKGKKASNKNFAIFVDDGENAPASGRPAAGIWKGIGTNKERNKENKKAPKALQAITKSATKPNAPPTPAEPSFEVFAERGAQAPRLCK